MNTHDILIKSKGIAVIGVSEDSNKYGYKIFKALLDAQFNVYGISDRYTSLEGITLYSSLKDIPDHIDLVVFVISRKYALPYINEMRELNIKSAWMQPGTYDDELLSLMEDLNIIRDCVLIQLKSLQQN